MNWLNTSRVGTGNRQYHVGTHRDGLVAFPEVVPIAPPAQ